jgi:hypothetical protein
MVTIPAAEAVPKIASEPALPVTTAGTMAGFVPRGAMRSVMPAVVVMMHSVLFPFAPAHNGAGRDDIVKIYLFVKIYLNLPEPRSVPPFRGVSSARGSNGGA